MLVLQIFMAALGFLLLAGIDFYVFTGIRPLIDRMRHRGWQRFWMAFFWMIPVVVGGGLVLTTLFGSKATVDAQRFGSMVFGLLVLFYLPKLVFCLFLILEDLFRLGSWSRKRIQSTQSSEPVSLPSRRRFVSQMGLVAAGVPFVPTLHGLTFGKYNFQVRREKLFFNDLPPAFDGLTIAQISDIHAGSFDSVQAVKRGVALVQELQADLLLFTGDLVNDRAKEVEEWLDIFGQLTAPLGVYSTLGNHDYGESVRWASQEEQAQNLAQLKAHHHQMGFQLLNNTHQKLQRGTDTVTLVGVENWGVPPFPQFGDLDQALAGTNPDEFRILLSHDPSHWEAKVLPHDYHMHLTLSGHTHGLQFGIETPGWKWSPVQYKYPQWAGLYEQAGQYLYVNRGFGFIAFPGRVGIWPEITHLTLYRA